MDGATSARELLLETSKFLAVRGCGPEIMASHAIRQQARLWHAARGLLRMTLHEAMERSKSGRRRARLVEQPCRLQESLPLAGETEQTARLSFQKNVRSFSNCLVEGVAKLTAYLSDNRAQSVKMLNSMMMTRGVGRVEVEGRWWTSPACQRFL